MGFWKDLLSGNKDDSEDGLDRNSERIATNEDEIEELREMLDDTPKSDYEAHESITWNIQKRKDRLDYLRKRKDELNKDDHDDPVEDCIDPNQTFYDEHGYWPWEAQDEEEDKEEDEDGPDERPDESWMEDGR